MAFLLHLCPLFSPPNLTVYSSYPTNKTRINGALCAGEREAEHGRGDWLCACLLGAAESFASQGLPSFARHTSLGDSTITTQGSRRDSTVSARVRKGPGRRMFDIIFVPAC